MARIESDRIVIGEQEAGNPFPLLALPDELIVMVLRQLRLAEQVNAYESCETLRRLLAERRVVAPRFSLGRGPLATVDALRRPLLRDLAPRIHHLDLSCVFDLSFTKLATALKRMTNLTGIDISHTNLRISDLRKGFPSLKNIYINFDLNFSPDSATLLQHLQTDILNKAERIHFVSTAQSASENTGLKNVLVTIKNLKELQFTWNRVDIYIFLYLSEINFVPVQAFHVNFVSHYGDYRGGIVWENFEMIFVENYQMHPKILMTKTLYNKFKVSNCSLSCPVDLVQNIEMTIKTKWSLYMWHRKIVEHNQDFYEKIFLELERKVAIYACIETWSQVKPNKQNLSNSYYISPCTFVPLDASESSVPQPKKRRSRLENVRVELEKYVKPDTEIKLTLGKFCSCTISPYALYFKPSAQLKNLTFLHLQNVIVLHTTFFQNVFTTCKKLMTLNVDNDTWPGAGALLSSALHLAESLRNLRLRQPADTPSQLYPAMSQCPTLENVHVCEVPCRMKVSKNSLIDFITKCEHLYSFCVYSDLGTVADAKNLMKIIRNAASNKNLQVELNQTNNPSIYITNKLNCDPYLDLYYQDSVYRSIHLDLEFP